MSFLFYPCLRSIYHFSKRNRISYTISRKFLDELRCINAAKLHTTSLFYKKRKTPDDRIIVEPKRKGELIQIWNFMTPRELSEALRKDLNYVRQLFLNKINDVDAPLEDIKLVLQAVKRSGNRAEIVGRPCDDEPDEDRDAYPRPPATPDILKPRPAVVAVMGHVDHGKTTLLDALRKSSLVDRESGGITQYIGAFGVKLPGDRRVTFLDTPGHAAFSAMRERGANLTDMVVLVVAADDGVMEQTIESVNMAKRAQVPILVAINKIDSPKANVERAKQALLEIGVQIEDLGGDVQAIPISALKKINLERLVEALILQAELLQIGADYSGPCEAVVVESRIDQHRGRLCTVVVKRGTLKKGAILVAGTSTAKVRLLKDEDGRILSDATPGRATEIDGWRELPSPGDVVLEVGSERRAKEVVRCRERKLADQKDEEALKVIKSKMEEHEREYGERLRLRRKLGRFKLKREGPRPPEYQKEDKLSLNVIVKGDVDGTVEAIVDALDTYDSNQCELELVHYGVGRVTETDVELAEAFGAIVYAFNVECDKRARELADESRVRVRRFDVIYRLVEDVAAELETRLQPVEVEEPCGEATVIRQYEIAEKRKTVPTAGCRCTKGVLKKGAIYKLIRNGEVIHTGELASLRHVKDEVETIKTNVECGLQLKDKSITFEPGDVLVCVEKKLIQQKLNWDPGF